MPTDVVMPQMGESIFEGTITKWLKKAGDAVQKDEPLFEISTDKVDAEIPSPVTGVLQDIRVAEGETVEVNTVVAVVSEETAEGTLPKSVQPAPSFKAEPQASQPSKSKPLASGSAPQALVAPPQGATVAVVMPQMGESIFEGTITKWLKKAGDTVQKDEPLFEISTDKVDAEIPSPVSGVLTEVKVGEGETVEINTVVAVIAGNGSGVTAVAQSDGSPSEAVSQSEAAARVEARPSPASMPGPAEEGTPEPDSSRETIRSSPLVRRMAREHKLDLRRINGTGSGGRISKEDVVAYMKNGAAASQTQPADQATAAPQAPLAQPQGLGKLEPMSRMRSIIAQRMVESRHTSPHAYSVYKVDMTRVVRMRERSRTAFEQRNGVKLHLHAVHRGRGPRGTAALSDCECIAGGQCHSLPREHSSRDSGGAGVGIDRPCDPGGGTPQLPRFGRGYR